MGSGRGSGGVLDCCGVAAKYIVFIFNFIILLIGLALVVLGAIALAHDDFSKFKDFDPVIYQSSAFGFLIVGLVIVVFSFLGCCGAIKESRCLLMTYASLVFTVFVIVLLAAVLAVVFKDDAKEYVDTTMKKFITNYDANDKNKPETRAWDVLQQTLHCCGINSYTDWTENIKPIPQSCCKNGGPCSTTVGAITAVFTDGPIYSEGCVAKVFGDVGKFTGAIGYVLLIFAAILLLAIILSCCVGCSL